jgi:hypothetical protein
MPQSKKKKRRKRGNIGQQIFEQVEKLVADQKIPRLTAFKQLSKKTGRRVGTVAANYYRVARKSGAKLRRRVTGRVGRPPAARRGAVRGRRGSAGARVGQLLQDLVTVVRNQEAELERLIRENKRLAEIRKLLVGR